MPRVATLEPSFIKGRQRPWMLSIPPDLSETGKRQQLFFLTREETETAAEQIKTRKRNFGNSLTHLTPARINEAGEAFHLLDSAGIRVSLLSLIRESISQHQKRQASTTLEALFGSYIDAHSSKSWHHLAKLKSCQKRFREQGGVLVSDLHHEDFEPELNRLTPSMKNAQLRLLRSVLNFGVKRGYLDTNPLDRLDFADIKRKEVQTIPADLVEKMLVDARINEPSLVPFLVFGFFCGIRPMGELTRLKWSDVHFDEKTVTIRKEISKTGRRRFIDLSENTLAWLSLSNTPPPNAQRKVVPFSWDELREKRESLWRRVAPRRQWIHQGMRHTFCSCWLAKHHDVNRLLLQTGHTSPQMLWDNYHLATKQAEAEKFWSITPGGA